MVAPTICWAAFGTKERAFLMKCTRHLCHEAPCKTASMTPLRPRWASLVTSLTRKDLERPKSVKTMSRKRRPRWDRRPTRGSPARRFLPYHPNGDHHRSRTHPTVLASLHVGCVEPHVGVSALQRSVPKALDLLVELLTKLRNPALGDARHAQSLHQ